MSLKFKMQPGGVVDGASHNNGGVPAVSPDGDQIAEVEGGERIFSIKDTEEIEQRAAEITEALDNKDDDLANELAKMLGHRVVEMIARQERINPSE